MASESSSGATGAVLPPASWLVRSTSPLHCVLAFACGAGLQRAFGWPLPQGGLRDALHVAGTLLANAGLLVVVWCFALFALSRTALLPDGAPACLVRRGPFRLSRNPIYVGMVASYAGLALMYDVPWALLTLSLPVLVLQHAVVPYEEMRLRARFGDEYAAYCRAVRRWL